MSHLHAIRDDAAYSEILANWDAQFYAKFTNTLRPRKVGARVLDVGCGVGQVVAKLTEAGYEAHGVDVAEPNIVKARRISALCQLYDGQRLPYPDQHFASVGALNVLEHVEEPEAFLRELVRVTESGGKIVVSSPNFYRVFGFRDYHPQMRGFWRKVGNLNRLLAKRQEMRASPARVRFDRMKPIIKEPFTPDDDAIVATNPQDMRFFLSSLGCTVETVACTDRYIPVLLDKLLNLGPWRYGMFNSFVVARRNP